MPFLTWPVRVYQRKLPFVMYFIQDFQTEIPLDIDNSIQMLYLKLKIFKRELFIGLMLPKSEPNNLGNKVNQFGIIQVNKKKKKMLLFTRVYSIGVSTRVYTCNILFFLHI